MAAIQVTFYYETDPKHYKEGASVEDMVADDVEQIQNGELHLLDLEDIAYRIDFDGKPHME